MLIYIHFSSDLLGLNNVDFENYFANELIKDGSFFKPFKALVQSCLSEYKMLGFRGSAWRFISDKALLRLNHKLVLEHFVLCPGQTTETRKYCCGNSGK